ncbi:MAG: hypothetical protein Q7S95_01745 [bacterium]|nr:hypothetical protein [bacterium]
MATLYQFPPPRPQNERGRRILIDQNDRRSQPDTRSGRTGTTSVTPGERRTGESVWEAVQEYIGLPEPEKEMLVWRSMIDWVHKRTDINPHRRDVREKIAVLLMSRAYGAAYTERMLADPKFREIAGLPLLK